MTNTIQEGARTVRDGGGENSQKVALEMATKKVGWPDQGEARSDGG
jgi:hypothetical protein